MSNIKTPPGWFENACHDIDWSSHPVDILVALAKGMGIKLDPGREHVMRRICDEPVEVKQLCGGFNGLSLASSPAAGLSRAPSVVVEAKGTTRRGRLTIVPKRPHGQRVTR